MGRPFNGGLPHNQVYQLGSVHQPKNDVDTVCQFAVDGELGHLDSLHSLGRVLRLLSQSVSYFTMSNAARLTMMNH